MVIIVKHEQKIYTKHTKQGCCTFFQNLYNMRESILRIFQKNFYMQETRAHVRAV